MPSNRVMGCCAAAGPLGGCLVAAPRQVNTFEPGWTYLFEAVSPDNLHAVQYSFEGLVLLTAVAPDGRELPAGSAALGQLGGAAGGDGGAVPGGALGGAAGPPVP
jgi:hypothetical protein